MARDPRRSAKAATTLLAILAGHLALMASGQSNMCYPKSAGKRPPFKKGGCFLVTHTFPEFLGHDTPPALDPLDNDFALVDRHTGAPVDPACRRTKVYLSTDASDTNLGHFKREAWATQALTLVQGRLHVDFAAIAANLPGPKDHKASKDNATQIAFMMEFDCPASSVTAIKQPRRSEFRLALRYVPAPANVNANNFQRQFLLHLQALSGRTFSSSSSSSLTTSMAATSTEPTPSLDRIHEPACPFMASIPNALFCKAFAVMQRILLDRGTSFMKSLSCAGQYPSYMQGFVNQSMNLATDRDGRRLPGPFANLLRQNNGSLPEQVDWDTVGAEKATLFWLFDKILQLSPWASCANGHIPYPFMNQFAPGFGPTTLYFINNTNEFVDQSNYTTSALAKSGVGLDADGNTTFVLIVRGTAARSEWINDFQYGQVLVTPATLSARPLLALFARMAIHAGFAGLFEQIYGDIKADVAAASPHRILVAGHSLGGGMAQLLSLALATDFPSIRVDAAMFAPPAVGDAIFAETFNTKVNGRRIAYVSDDATPPSLLTNMGDAVPQTLCPDQPVCAFPRKDPLYPVPVPTKVDLRKSISYRAVGGNILFTWRHLPDPPAAYGLQANLIRETYRRHDDLVNEFKSHTCTYSCFFSTAVNASLTKCLLPGAVHLYPHRIPLDVQTYGLCYN